MNERRIQYTIYLEGTATQTGEGGVVIDHDFKLTSVGHFTTLGGTVDPTDVDLQLQDDGVNIGGTIVAADASAGVNQIDDIADLEIASGWLIEVDATVTGGTAPTYECWLTLHGFIDEA